MNPNNVGLPGPPRNCVYSHRKKPNAQDLISPKVNTVLRSVKLRVNYEVGGASVGSD